MSVGHAMAHPALDPDILRGRHLIEADAGTGKTWTLVGLVVRALVERQLGIEQILMVTFTRAAAAELRSRVRERIEELLHECAQRESGPSGDPVAALLLANHDASAIEGTLRVALARIDDARIDTIHGLCQRLIREHALSIGAPVRFEIEESGGGLLRSELSRWWGETIGAAPLPLVQLLGASPGTAPDALARLLGPLLEQPDLELRPGPFDWRALGVDVCRQRDALLAAIAIESDELAAWCQSSTALNHRSYNRKRVPAWIEKLRQFTEALPQAVGKLDGPELERLSREGFASPQSGAVDPPFALPRLVSELVATLRRVPLIAAAICHELRAPFAARLRARQDAAGTLGFDDLLRITNEALRVPLLGPRLAAQLRQRYPLALIDECQDTDPVQWQIFSSIYPRDAALAGAPHDDFGLVIVGDPKQAIYGFRNADIYAYFAARDGTRRHRIGENRRASAELLRAIGALFAAPHPFRLDEIEMPMPVYGERPRAVICAEDPKLRRAALNWVLVSSVAEEGLNKENARERAARATAAEIARLLGEPATRVRWPADPRAGRPEREAPVQPRDIAVLVNTAFEAQRIKRSLVAQGIGAAEISRESVFATREARELGRLLTAIVRPASAGALRGAMLTALVGWTVDRLRDAERDAAVWPDVLAAVGNCARNWARLGAQAALRLLLLHDLAAAGRIAAAPGGERALTNLAHLLDLMSDCPRTSDSPAAALAWLDAARADEFGGESRELRLESDANLVQIVTIHKSKGLEYPLVFIPFAWSQRGGARARSGAPAVLRYHEPDAGHWRAVCELDNGQAERSRHEQAEREQASEQARLLYVALTRAQLRVYLFWGNVSGAPETALGWLLGCGNSGLPEPDAARVGTLAAGAEMVARVDRHLTAARGAALRIDHDALGAEGSAREPVCVPVASLQARAFRRRFAPVWVRRSYSSLARDSALETAQRPDHDEAAVAPMHFEFAEDAAGVLAASPESAPDLRFSFVRGAHAGHCIHGVLEATDFAAGVKIEIAGHHLARNAIVADAGAVAHWLNEVLATPLVDGRGGVLDLRAIVSADRIVELPFLLPVRGAVDREILAAVADHYPLDLRGGSEHWSGFLNGFIDLVYRDRGRYYLLDWKSNWLGDRHQHYGQAALGEAIRDGSYALQFCLYALALHRTLQRRVRAYRFDEHFGGVHYAFLRGMAPGACDASGHPYGLYFARPPQALVARLDECFGRETP